MTASELSVEPPGPSSVVECPQCSLWLEVVPGRKDAICSRCGFKVACCEGAMY